MKKINYLSSKKTSQDRQDEILKKMSDTEKIRIVSALSTFCLRLNSLNHLTHGHHRSRKIIN